LNERFGWRSTLWFLALGGVVQFLLLLFFLPETMRPPRKIPAHEPSNSPVRELTKWEVFKVYIIDPLKLLRLLRYPPVLLAITYAAVTFGILVFHDSYYLMVVLCEHLYNVLFFNRPVQLYVNHHWVLSFKIFLTQTSLSRKQSGISSRVNPRRSLVRLHFRPLSSEARP
jgi:MFS family permease